MGNNENQLGLFSSKTLVLDLPDADICYMPDFYGQEHADRLFRRILESTHWRQEEVKVYGRTHLTPRLSCWMGDAGLDYSYSNTTMTPVAWNVVLLEVKSALEKLTGDAFNSVLINYYRDGQDSNGWHSDDEPELGKDPVIASVSLGAARDFHLRHKLSKQKQNIALEHGSLLMMRGPTQRCWQHHVPKRAKADGRINLTFRMIKNSRAGKPRL